MKKKKLTCEKILKWTVKDKVQNFVVYVANAIIIIGIFLLMVHVNAIRGGSTFEAFFQNPNKIIETMVFVVLCIGITAVYIYFEDRNFMKDAKNSEMIFLVLEISLLVCYAFGKFVNIYLRPLPLCALTVMFLTGRKNAVFINAIFSIIMFLADNLMDNLSGATLYSALLIGFSAGVVALYCMSKVYSRIRLIYLSAIISLPTLVCALLLLAEGGWDGYVTSLICAACSGPLTVAIFIVFLPIYESIFKKVSCFKLAELTDHKAKLIRRLINEAPGTFNHSIVVSNIAEACATAIDEDALLARTCAYYHDIGKLRRPEYFGENQSDGVNPHNDLTPELSTNIIKSHTQDGYNLVLKNRLPVEIADVCLQHHGTLPILYFYNKAKKFTDGEVDINQFCYGGPKPQTKIAAIIMIADGCEAAARTLKDRSRENVAEVVRKIVSDRMELGQFDECEITLKELDIIIHTVVNNLTGIYHSRVKYPKVSFEGINFNKEEETDDIQARDEKA